MKKERIILDRSGTLLILSLLPFFFKMVFTTFFSYYILFPLARDVFPKFYDALLFSIAVYASDNLNILNKMREMECP